jgi:hypothetical protein
VIEWVAAALGERGIAIADFDVFGDDRLLAIDSGMLLSDIVGVLRCVRRR